MMKNLIKITLLITVFVSSAIGANAESRHIIFPKSKSANVGVIVRNIHTGNEIISENPDLFLTPASVLKCVTAAAVILDNRENNVFKTETHFTGYVSPDSILLGDIIIKGVGDPSIESDNFPEFQGLIDSIASSVSKCGIKHIAGGISIDSIAFKEQGPIEKWEVEDLKWAYGTGLYALNFRDNTYGIDRAMREPGEFFVDSLESRLRRDSIKIDWNESNLFTKSKTPLYTHNSPAINRILRIMIEKSNNMYAESMLRLLAPGEGLDKALKRENEILDKNGFDCESLIACDGSGLTRSSKTTPRFIADLLQRMALSNKGDLYVSLFPKAGEEGTVKKLLKNTALEGKFALKSGSMKGVQCFAGYKLNEMGKPTHVVVIMVNDFICSRKYVNKGIERFLTKRF